MEFHKSAQWLKHSPCAVIIRKLIKEADCQLPISHQSSDPRDQWICILTSILRALMCVDPRGSQSAKASPTPPGPMMSISLFPITLLFPVAAPGFWRSTPFLLLSLLPSPSSSFPFWESNQPTNSQVVFWELSVYPQKSRNRLIEKIAEILFPS